MEQRIAFVSASHRRYIAGDLLIPHEHDAHALHYIAEGSGTFRIGEQVYQVKAGDCFLVLAGQVHALLPVKQAIVIINIRLRFTDPFFTAAFDPNETLFLNAPCFASYFNYIYRNRSSSSPEHIRNTEDILSTLLLGFHANTLTYTRDWPTTLHTEQYTKPTRMVMVYVENQIGKRIRFDEMASQLFYNKSYLCEIFKAETGITISEYINFLRIHRSLDRFVFNNYSISNVLFSAGFSSASYFSKVFKKTLGLTPSEFQKLLRLVSDEERKLYFTETPLLKFKISDLDTYRKNFAQFKNGLQVLKTRYQV